MRKLHETSWKLMKWFANHWFALIFHIHLSLLWLPSSHGEHWNQILRRIGNFGKQAGSIANLRFSRENERRNESERSWLIMTMIHYNIHQYTTFFGPGVSTNSRISPHRCHAFRLRRSRRSRRSRARPRWANGWRSSWRARCLPTNRWKPLWSWSNKPRRPPFRMTETGTFHGKSMKMPIFSAGNAANDKSLVD